MELLEQPERAWAAFVGLPRPARVVMVIGLIAPWIFWVTGDVGDSTVLWAIILATSIVPSLVVRALIPPVDGIPADDARHPRMTLAYFLMMAAALACGIVIVAIDRLIVDLLAV